MIALFSDIHANPEAQWTTERIVSLDPKCGVLELARANHVDRIVLDAPGPSRKTPWWRSAASTVTANAPCSVQVVRMPVRRTGARRSPN